MSIKLEGFFVPMDSWPRARELAMMFVWRYHNVMKHVKDDMEGLAHRYPGMSPHEYKATMFRRLAEEYHADPDFVTAQLFHVPGSKFFMRWLDYSAGFKPEDMVEELMLPWIPVEYYSITGSKKNIDRGHAFLIMNKIRKDIRNRAYFVAPMLQYDDPINAHGFNMWPPCIRDFKDTEMLLHDGVEAPLPVFHDYDAERLDNGIKPG